MNPSSMLFDENGLDTLIDEADVVQTHGDKLHDEGQKVNVLRMANKMFNCSNRQ